MSVPPTVPADAAASPVPAGDEGELGMERAASAEGLEVDWSTVDPAALASMEMALAMGANFDGPLAQRARADAAAAEAASGAAASGAALAATLAVLDAGGEAKLAEELTRLAAEMAEVEEQQRAAAAAADDEAEAEAAGEEEAEERPAGSGGGPSHAVAAATDAGEDEEEGGMGAPSGTAEGSWGGEEEWVLEGVLRRRKARGERGVSSGVAAADPEMEGDEDEWEYLCRWRGYAASTWERRGFLRECGLGPRVAAFDAEAAPKVKTSTRKLRPKKPAGTTPPWVVERQRKAEAREEQRLALVAARIKLQKARQNATAFKRCATSVMEAAARLGRHAEDWLYVVERFSNCARITDDPALRTLSGEEGSSGSTLDLFVGSSLLLGLFAQLNTVGYPRLFVSNVAVIDPDTIVQLAAYLRAHEAAQLALVFHGTRKEAIRPIEKQGLLVPRPHINGVRVVNGSAYGLGIYTAANTPTPVAYSRGSSTLFVCIGVANDPRTVFPGGGVYVFGDDELVAPVLRLTFAENGATNTVYGTSGNIESFEPPAVYC